MRKGMKYNKSKDIYAIYEQKFNTYNAKGLKAGVFKKSKRAFNVELEMRKSELKAQGINRSREQIAKEMAYSQFTTYTQKQAKALQKSIELDTGMKISVKSLRENTSKDFKEYYEEWKEMVDNAQLDSYEQQDLFYKEFIAPYYV